MSAKAAELQREVKENAEDYQNYLKDLYGWEKEMKLKDEMLKKSPKPSLDDKEFPIRNKKTISVTNEKSSSTSLNGSSSLLSDHQTKQKAILEKNKGNDFFKEGKYEKALEHYSNAIKLDPTDSILPANRAIALIKLNRFAEAEEDCNKSLDLDPTFVKAYHRRGTSRANTGKIELAISDFEKVLSIEPHNKAALQELEKLLKFKENENEKSKNSGISKTKGGKFKSSDNTQSGRAPESIRAKKATIVDLSLNHPSLTVIEELNPISNTDKVKPAVKVSIASVNDNKQEDLAIGKLVNQLSGVKHVEVNTSQLPTTLVVNSVPSAPKNYIQFESDWMKLKNNGSLRYQYLKQLIPIKLPDLFRESLETDVLGGIIETLRTEFVEQNEPIFPWLVGLSRVKRISAVMMFISSKQKTDLEFLRNHLITNGEGTEEERKAVFNKLS